MPVKTEIYNHSGIFFITFTCLHRIPLFAIVHGYDAVYKWFNWLKEHGHYIIGFVIMPSHVHAMIAFVNTGKTINSMVANGKRFMAYEMVNRLKENNREEILKQLADARTPAEIAANKLHKVFENSFDWKWCNSGKLIEQKLEYIHQNPCKGKWMLADTPVEYEHCSAKYYFTGEQGKYRVTDYREIEDMDLHTLRQQ